MGGWAIAQSPIRGTTTTIDRLERRGYVSLLEIYKKISPQLNEPLYTCLRVAASAKAGETRTYSGVRGALRQLILAEPSTRLVPVYLF